MRSRKGFTLIELMVVILIVGILAAVAIPIMRGRIDSAKWSEGRAGAGSIRTACRAFMAEKGPGWGGVWGGITLGTLGFQAGDLNGKYFTDAAYGIAVTAYDTYLITVTALNSVSPDKPTLPAVVTIDQNGDWVVDGVAE
jgi:prepilin-type N-terminal cleavage/methylation domain-containing protein